MRTRQRNAPWVDRLMTPLDSPLSDAERPLDTGPSSALHFADGRCRTMPAAGSRPERVTAPRLSPCCRTGQPTVEVGATSSRGFLSSTADRTTAARRLLSGAGVCWWLFERDRDVGADADGAVEVE